MNSSLDHVVVGHFRQDQVLLQDALSQHLGVLQRPLGERRVGAGVEEVAQDPVVYPKVASPVPAVERDGAAEIVLSVKFSFHLLIWPLAQPSSIYLLILDDCSITKCAPFFSHVHF